MPPLVWREKITICPVCLGIVKPMDSICPFCNAEFEMPLNKKVMHVRNATMKEAIWLATVVSTSFLSALFLIVALFLSDMHRFVPPVHENVVPYSAVLSAILLVSAFFLVINKRREREGTELSRLSLTMPIVTILISGVLLIFVQMAREIDRMLAEQMYYIIVTIVVVLALLLLSHLRFITGFRNRKNEN